VPNKDVKTMKSCLSRTIVGIALLIQLMAAALGMLVLGSAGVLGEAALMSAEDALIIFALLGVSLIATLVLGAKIWLASRTRRRLHDELFSARNSSFAQSEWG
jgi:hypothetical protein